MAVAGIILAAGASARMGRPKALVKIGETTFLERIHGTLAAAGVGEIVVVLGADEDKILPEISWFRGTVVVNGEWRDGQAGSVAAGLGALEGRKPDGVLLAPVDHPLVSAGLVSALLAAFERHPGRIILPVCRGRRGHPVLFPSRLFGDLRDAPRGEGVRHVVHAHAGEIVETPTQDEGVLQNIDTPSDLERIR